MNSKQIAVFIVSQMTTLNVMLDFAIYKNCHRYLIFFNATLMGVSIAIATILMTNKDKMTISDFMGEMDATLFLFMAYIIFVNILKGKTALAETYEIFLIFYKKNLMKQEHRSILDILSEAVITVEECSLTYFNRQAKKILYQCVESIEDIIPNGVMIERTASDKKTSKKDILL